MSQTLSQRWKSALCGGLAGFCNGLFGGGGGMVLIPLLLGWVKTTEKQTFATSTAVLLPVCAVSCGVYWWKGSLDFGAALPFLLGGAVGGWLGGQLYRRVNGVWLRRVFALMTLYGGLKCFL